MPLIKKKKKKKVQINYYRNVTFLSGTNKMYRLSKTRSLNLNVKINKKVIDLTTSIVLSEEKILQSFQTAFGCSSTI